MKLTSIVQIFTPFSGGYLSVEIAPDILGCEWTLGQNDCHWRFPTNNCHWSLDRNDVHWSLTKED